MAGITLLRPPPSLRSPLVGPPVSVTSWNNYHDTRRWPPSRISMSSLSHHQGNKAPADFVLRAVHKPAPTPVLGNFSRSSRRPGRNNAHHILPRATINNGFTAEFFNIVSLAQGAFRGSLLGGEKSIGLVTRARFDSLVQQVMGLFALAQYKIWRLGCWLSYRDKEIILNQILYCATHFLFQLIFMQVKICIYKY